ncbi:MAG: type II secretion system F family protein, partial [Hylemonella sp.]|nr:type II secretion system F family protein [Hylemonella sp.]
MSSYTWRGRNARGELVQGQLDAMTQSGVADQLLAIGVVPVHIAEVAIASASNKTANWWQQLNRRPIKIEEVLMFSRQMFTLNKAGVPILRAFAGLEASSDNPSLVAVLSDVRAGLDQGRDLSTSF